MYNNFDYQNCIEKIKSALYDIYEHQEIIIGEEEDENKKGEQVEKYIKVKDLAVKLLEDINNLYSVDNVDNVTNNEIEPTIVQESKQDELLKNSEISNDTNVEDDKEEEKEENVDLDDLPKFYLDNRNGEKPNFAYVPNSIFTKLKDNAILDLFNNKFYKQDDDKKRGIIVREDQFMKLSLSRDRQEGVLKEAKEFRILEAKKSRKRLQEID